MNCLQQCYPNSCRSGAPSARDVDKGSYVFALCLLNSGWKIWRDPPLLAVLRLLLLTGISLLSAQPRKSQKHSSTPSLHSAPPPAADTYLFIHWHLPGVFLPLVKLCQLFLHPFSTHWEISPTTAQFPADQRCVNSGIMLFKYLTKKTKTPKKKTWLRAQSHLCEVYMCNFNAVIHTANNKITSLCHKGKLLSLLLPSPEQAWPALFNSCRC